jgi:hypothetical protein
MKAMHISRHFIGTTAKFTPLVPTSQNVGEREMPARICAAQTVAQCWAAIACCADINFELKKNAPGYYFFVYQFAEPNGFVKNESVMDFAQTGELVAYEAQEAELVGCFFVNAHDLKNKNFAGVAIPCEIEEGIENYSEQREAVRKAERAVEEMEWEF